MAGKLLISVHGMEWSSTDRSGSGNTHGQFPFASGNKNAQGKKADDVSLVMLIVLMSGIILWIVYGIKKDDMPIMATNSFSLLVNILMVVLRMKYKK